MSRRAASILRGLKGEGEATLSSQGKVLEAFYFNLGESHPFYEANHDRLAIERPAYAWYIRVADLQGFLKLIAPALEARLAGSWAAGHTGQLKISFYRWGLRLALERGRFTAIEPWTPASHDDEGDCRFPRPDVPADGVRLSGLREPARRHFPMCGRAATKRVAC